jgi:hypothetical protein
VGNEQGFCLLRVQELTPHALLWSSWIQQLVFERRWIPAFAGMTMWGTARHWIPACAGMTTRGTSTTLDSGMRRNDGVENSNDTGFRHAPE